VAAVNGGKVFYGTTFLISGAEKTYLIDYIRISNSENWKSAHFTGNPVGNWQRWVNDRRIGVFVANIRHFFGLSDCV